MKIINTEKKREPDSILSQFVLVVLSIILMVISVQLVIVILNGSETRLVGLLIAESVFIVAFIIYFLKRGFLAGEVVTAIEGEMEEGKEIKVVIGAPPQVDTAPPAFEGRRGVIRTLVLLLIVGGVMSGIGYQAGKSGVVGVLGERGQELSEAEATIAELESKVESLEERMEEVTVATIEAGPEDKITCTLCHVLETTKRFHYLERIIQIDESKGIKPRLCTTCHGLSPHVVHMNKISKNEMTCETCHTSKEGDYMVPQIPEGGLLICEACHPFSREAEDRGNYIQIHVVEGKKECTTCHLGDPTRIHKIGIEKLGQTEES